MNPVRVLGLLQTEPLLRPLSSLGGTPGAWGRSKWACWPCPGGCPVLRGAPPGPARVKCPHGAAQPRIENGRGTTRRPTWKEALGGFCFMCLEPTLFLPLEERGGGRFGRRGEGRRQGSRWQEGPGATRGQCGACRPSPRMPASPGFRLRRVCRSGGAGVPRGWGPGTGGEGLACGLPWGASLGADSSPGLDAAEPKLLCHRCVTATGGCRGDW